MNYVETYRGADIYLKGKIDSVQHQVINLKLIARGLMPDPENLIIHFDAEASSKDEALTKIKTEIDDYLAEHHLNKLISEH